ncbi:hypothetical protein BDB00DRAFT_356542 [Zychaea mexicana]|uniref:uncharacterized protein n=1 Tax=Zychaea mexicana TaxID=64656 RepID=UPI0022FF3E95|nr:uncharacterized protein BDB00DRAFT_356542 [Zychaea mexicana]KAI9493823.1 hypothetical protein BDB00DRAFT_356542 [Zychaea mexicana]
MAVWRQSLVAFVVLSLGFYTDRSFFLLFLLMVWQFDGSMAAVPSGFRCAFIRLSEVARPSVCHVNENLGRIYGLNLKIGSLYDRKKRLNGYKARLYHSEYQSS